MDERSIELARQTGSESRSVLIELRDAGIRVSAQDFGPATQLMGSDDGELEFWVDVPAESLQRLCAMLLRDRFHGHLQAVSEFRSYCEENGIRHKFMIWS